MVPVPGRNKSKSRGRCKTHHRVPCAKNRTTKRGRRPTNLATSTRFVRMTQPPSSVGEQGGLSAESGASCYATNLGKKETKDEKTDEGLFLHLTAL